MVGIPRGISTNTLQKQITMPATTVILLNLLDMVGEVWGTVNGEYTPSLAPFLPLPLSIPSLLQSCLPVNLAGREGFIPGRLHPMVKVAGQGMLKVLGINLCISPTSIRMPSIPAVALCRG